MAQELKRLRDIVVNAVDTILDVCEQRGKDFPSLDRPADPADFASDSIRNDPRANEAVLFGVAAAAQLIATLDSPATTLYKSASRYNLSSCLAAAERLHVAEILRDADPKGMHIDAIVEANGADANKLGRVLRYLATNHIFREVSPNVFAHNMISSLIDTGKTLSEIHQDPTGKFDNTTSIAAFTSFIADECMKSGAYLDRTLTDPDTARSQDPDQTSIQKAFGFQGSRWEWIERSENRFTFRRYGAAMSGSSKLQPPSAVLTGYNWASLPEGAVFADIGGGIGNVCLEVAKIRPDLTFILEDRPAVIEKAKKYWEHEVPEMRSSDKVHFIGHDFFVPQPTLPMSPDIFFLRTVMHDWSDANAKKILVNLRRAAKPGAKLLLVDTLIEYACSSDEVNIQIPGYTPPKAPEPLLPNLGYSGIVSYDLDIIMLNNLNGRERTIGDFARLLSSSGWRLVEVRKNSENKMWWPTIVAEPA